MKTWKSKAEMQDGINSTVAMCLYRAKEASREASKYLQAYRADGTWQFPEYLRCRAERSNWIYAARHLIMNTSDGVLTDAALTRNLDKIRRKVA